MVENNLAQRVAVLEANLERVESTQDQILKQLQSISENLTKYKGFVGGVTFVATSFFTFLTFAKEWVITHLK